MTQINGILIPFSSNADTDTASSMAGAYQATSH